MTRHPPQKAFALFWLVWCLGLLTVVFWPLDVLWSRVLFSIFVPVELWAYFRSSGGLGDTLSEFFHWIERWAPDGTRWYQSWRALVVGFVVGTSWQAAWTAAYRDAPWDRWPVGVIVGGTLFCWLLYHWLRPEKYG